MLRGLSRFYLLLASSLVLSAVAMPVANAQEASHEPPVLHGVQLTGKDITINYSQVVDPDNGIYDVHFEIGEPDGEGGCDPATLETLGIIQLSSSISQQDISFIMPLPIPVPEEGYCVVAYNYIHQEVRSADSNKLFLYPSGQTDESSGGQVLGASTTNTPQVLAVSNLAETGSENGKLHFVLGAILVAGPLLLLIANNKKHVGRL